MTSSTRNFIDIYGKTGMTIMEKSHRRDILGSAQ